MDGLKETLLNMILSAITGFDDMVNSADGILRGTSFTGHNVWDAVLGLTDALKPFCYTIIGICVLIELAQVASKVDIIKWEHGLKVAVKLCISKLCIDEAPTFLRACYLQANRWVLRARNMGSYTNLGDLYESDIRTNLDSISGLWSIIGLLATCMILSMAIKICGLMVQVIAFGRMFEIYVYLAASPLPCAFFPLGDGTGSGMSRITMKFFKNFIAVCLQGVMIMLCIRIFYMVVGTAMDNLYATAIAGTNATAVVSDLCYTMLLGGVVLVMAVAKCGSWAKGIMDAA